jgi:ATP-binding cassette subfamily B protein
VLNGNLTIGELVAFNTYVALLIWPLRMLGQIVAQGQRAAAAGTRAEVLATDPQIVDHPHPRHLPVAKGDHAARRGALRRVTFSYSNRAAHPRQPRPRRQPGSSVALVGATGSGKTTIAPHPRFYDVTGGSVSIDGVDVRPARTICDAIGIVFEDTFLFNDTVRANIAFADPDASDEAVLRASRLAGAHDFITEMPDGYDSFIGERGFSLSGGQRQRIAIARAIVADPRVLILDDATSAVDPTKEHEIRDALAEVMRGRTTIVIAHRPATVALADRWCCSKTARWWPRAPTTRCSSRASGIEWCSPQARASGGQPPRRGLSHVGRRRRQRGRQARSGTGAPPDDPRRHMLRPYRARSSARACSSSSGR